ncbi:GNAT family N-acetyltransferase [Nitrogeniibacter mangrovi]|uniref:GNAT family N-acetyltransferase n=1 Tax=Nitrogeniibacter mangrovi TaxID=2016596 RepID=A0A6C1B5V7_9RHOO|nr:GNAT family N-acetyltransferase [Nitrogeniibacter mangrovi]QID18429.1 GNAT family N-acetyltransferase [Nitrogeniibacter mangrovi]
MNRLSIAPARAADTPGLYALFNAARAHSGHFPPHTHSIDEFRAVTEGERILVARRGHTLAGFAAIWVPDAFLHHLFIAPELQRQGIGRQLLDATLARFGAPMTLKCITTNTPARRFYEATGWQARETAMGPDGPYVLYAREIDPESTLDR